jgi:predicted SprT family Zn-dependent metalloprotease
MIERILSLLQKAPDPNVKVLLNAKDEILQVLAVEFNDLNQKHFKSKLKPPIIEFSTRKSYGGYYQKTRHRIVLSWQAFVEHGLDETLNTFRHEVAHIVHQHHRKEFWDLASQLGVTRKYAAAPLAPVRRRSRWYTYQCPSCKSSVQRRRRLKVNSSCSKCDTKYNPDYRLVLIGSEVK